MMDEAIKLLREKFGFFHFQPGQEEVIDHLLRGDSTVAVFPTGGGKSLCYQLPAMLLPGLTLVVSPLIALMKDQIDSLNKFGVCAARLDSTLSADEASTVIRNVREGKIRILYVAPERFNNERFRETIRQVQVSLFAVDEAHCISEWGHNFRPDYLKLIRFARACRAERLLALTATATEQVLDDICKAFRIAPECAVRTPFYRSNLALEASAVTVEERDDRLLELIQQREAGPTIVYVTLQRTAEIVAKRLSQAGLDAKAYHAGMANEKREQVQDWFISSQDGIVVATIAFGMGIDKANIRYVYHYNLPKSLENYAQEIGRSGRDGGPATCHLLACPDDLNVLENFIYGDSPTLEAVQSFLEDVFSRDEHFSLSYHELANDHDIRLLVVRTLITYLELDRFIEGGTPYFSTYHFIPRMTSVEILSKFEGERQDLLLGIFRNSKKAQKWYHVNLDTLSVQLSQPRDRLVRALDYLEEHGMLELKVAGIRHRFEMLQRPDDISRLAAALHRITIEREERELERIDQVLKFVQLDSCQAAALGAHFCSYLDWDCEKCSFCGNRHAIELPPRQVPPIDESLWEQVIRLKNENPEVLSNPVVLTRFLCGVNSPRLARAKLSSRKEFGAFARLPFKSILSECRQRVGDNG